MVKLANFEKGMILTVLFIFLSCNVFALGIVPARNVVNFKEGGIGTFDISVENTENKDMQVAVFLEGDGRITSKMQLSTTLLEFNAEESSKLVTYSYESPSDLEPGENQVKIIFRELPKQVAGGEPVVGTTVAVAHQFRIQVPYPGKYAVADLKVSETGKTDEVIFLVPVNNFGTQEILSAKGTIEIYDPSTNEKLATIQTNEKRINVGTEEELVGEWSEGVKIGAYLARVKVEYDGRETKEIERVFLVGKKEVELIDIIVNDYSLGQIAKFNVIVRNNWNENVKELFSEMVVTTPEDVEVARLKSSTEDVDAFGEQDLTVYWDTEGVEAGEYNLDLAIHHDDKITGQAVRMVVGLTSIDFDFGGLTGRAIGGLDELQVGTIITVSVTLLAIIGGSIVYIRKRKKKK